MGEKLENRLREEVQGKFMEFFMESDEFCLQDKRAISYFSNEAPIELVEVVLKDFNYSVHLTFAKQYWRDLNYKECGCKVNCGAEREFY